MVLYALMNRIPIDEIDKRVQNTIKKCNVIKYMEYDSLKKTYIINPSKIPDNIKVKHITKAIRNKGMILKFSGLTRQMKSTWYPTYNYKVESHPDSNASSMTKGTKVHDEVFKYLKDKNISTKYLDPYTRALLVWLSKRREMAQISELPCIGKGKYYATQADLIVQNVDTKKLILYEIKTGQLTDKYDGHLNKPMDKIRSNKINHAHLQLFYTKSAVELTTPIRFDECYVINVFQMKKKERPTVRRIPNPLWFKVLLNNKDNQNVLLEQLKYKNKQSDFNKFRKKKSGSNDKRKRTITKNKKNKKKK